MAAKRILITGANGFVGAWLARALVARGDDVRCLVRPKSDRSALEGFVQTSSEKGSGSTIVDGDVTDAPSLEKALDGVHTVFHLAGIRRGATRDAFMKVNAEGTRITCEAMVKAGCTRMVYVGSLAATGPSIGGVPRVEDDVPNPQEWYGESKGEGEKIAFGFSDRLEITSCRPARIVGPGDHENLTFFKLVKRGMILRIGGAERKLSFVDVEDVVDQMLLQADKKEAVGQAFFAASDEFKSVEELMTIVSQTLKYQARVVVVPELLLTFLGNAADAITNTTGKKLPLNRKLARQLLAPGWTCRIDKAKRVLGYAPKRTVFDSLVRSGESYVKLGWL
ncbi:MAG: NAD-dependent epimerase/dehydratase family protein [Archangium sp.]